MKKLFYFLFFFSSCIYSQKIEYSTLLISDSLKINANAVVRLKQVDISIPAQDKMNVKTFSAITVLNELGLDDLDLAESFDKNRTISNIKATVYDAFGKELKEFKRKDFKDVSVADGFSVFNDNRMLYLDYTPVTYPFTMVFESEITTSNTAFIPSWSPIENYLVSTERSNLTIYCNPELKLKYKELNFSSNYAIEKLDTDSKLSFSAKNLKALKRQDLTPSISKVFPLVMFSVEKFELENVKGNASSWEDFGKWYYASLLSDTEEIPEETYQKIKALVGNETDKLKIAQIIYKYVQEKTRYVSVQVGIGGWKPMLAKDVDKLGYGDCKALTNYTRSLLKSVGVNSYYSVVFAGKNRKDLQQGLSSIQGNHVILSLPTNEGLIWMECTSQTQPFGFQGDFTDDRKVLIIKPDGGEIVNTKVFTERDNVQRISASYAIDTEGKIMGNVVSKFYGLQYDDEFHIERESREDQLKSLKSDYSNINNLKISNLNFVNDKDKIEFTEKFVIEADNYGQISNGKIMFPLNAFDQYGYVPKKYKTREFPFEIERGYSYESETEINLPEGYQVEAKPNNSEINNEFGNYKIEFSQTSASKIVCKRKLVLLKGFYEKDKYETFRKFLETVAKTDNSKAIIFKA